MSLDSEQVKKIARLARLQIDENDIPGYAKNLSNILDLVAQMDNVNTDEIVPMAHPLDAAQRLRTDCNRNGFTGIDTNLLGDIFGF